MLTGGNQNQVCELYKCQLIHCNIIIMQDTIIGGNWVQGIFGVCYFLQLHLNLMSCQCKKKIKNRWKLKL